MKGMKRFTTALVGGLIVAISSLPASADTLFGVYAGAGSWQQEYGGDIRSTIASVDVEDDLGIDDESNNVLYFAFEHGVPLLPNVRAQFMRMDVDGQNVLSRSIDFNGQTFALSDNVATAVELDQTDALFYYQVLDSAVSLDLGLSVSMLEGQIDIQSSTEGASADFDEVIPMLYAGMRADLPLAGFWVKAEAQGVSFEGNSLMEYTALVGYESPIGLGIEAGYRSVQLELEDFEDVQNAQIDINGPYAALNFHF
ncbi:MAG: TIGR04219 family outer membrane beta-barrel protein [Pseudomonadales bacterium]|nr:TIGR04219 family outer membrane beta-barrel protein [Pseudomonadales bacterium]